jgi:hypothetical protein
MTGKEQTVGVPPGEGRERAWEPMSITRVGAFGEVLRGNTGSKTDMATKKAK